MQPCDLTLKTPRGTIRIHTLYPNEEAARADGWGLWFQFENYLVLGRDNRVGAAVKVD